MQPRGHQVKVETIDEAAEGENWVKSTRLQQIQAAVKMQTPDRRGAETTGLVSRTLMCNYFNSAPFLSLETEHNGAFQEVNSLHKARIA